MKEFRIYKRDDGKNIKDWTSISPLSNDEINSIPDTVMTGFGSKSGTSIPTALARLYLFDHALKSVNSSDNGILSAQTGNTSNHELVSHLLDLLELIYTKPNKLSFRYWDFNKEITRLQNSTSPKHQSLKQSLANTWENLKNSLNNEETSKIPELKGIHLIYYEGILLGGTSPLTVVFTSPNLVKDLKAAGKEILGTKGNHLFYKSVGNYHPLALHERDDNFRNFLLQYRVKYSNELSQQAKALFDYLSKNNTNHPPEINENKSDFDILYPVINSDSGAVTIIGLPLCHKTQEIIVTDDKPIEDVINSEFVMVPTVDYYKKMRHKNADIDVHTPLVIAKGSHDLVYWNGAKWDVSFENQLMNIRDINLWDRELPGFGVKYPYLSIGDFLEDKIMQLDYKINKDKFFTGIESDFRCLLPIRKEYFNFFKLEDLRRQLTIIEDSVNKTITVRLAIPIVGNQRMAIREMVFEKKYKGEDIVQYDEAAKSFILGIFPFYQTDKDDIDRYCIALGNEKRNIDLNFYQFKNIANKISTSESTAKERGYRKYIHLDNKETDNRFDIIIVNDNNVSGLILPLFKKVEVNSTGVNYVFCVDFGTSNTHITYNINKGDVKPFDIRENDQQMILLNQIDDFGNTITFKRDFKREFMPRFIFNEEKCDVSFPTRTVVFETLGLQQELPDLFGNINIGFSLINDLDEGFQVAQQFKTNLKWEKDSEIQYKRIGAFCKQIVWMIKNKILSNNGILNTTIIWTRPESMSVKLMNFYRKQWKEAIKEVFGNYADTIKIKELSESAAPYYAFISKHHLMSANNALNIDIGGGSTDILYLTQKGNQSIRKAYSSSVHFAASDLWGEGTEDISLQYNTNGYLALAKKLRQDRTTLPDNVKGTFDFMLGSAINSKFSSSDVISFVFSHDHKEFEFTEAIKNEERLYSLIFIHYASILYYVAQFIQKLELPVPENITFTGMGSLYLKIISERAEDIEALSSLLLKKFTNTDIPGNFSVKFTPFPKEITAEGAVYGNGKTEIKEFKCKHFGFKEDTDKNSSFTIEDIDSKGLKDKVLDNLDNFLEILSDREINNYLYTNYELKFDKKTIEKIKQLAPDSFNQIHFNFDDQMADIPESMFFWTLKETLYRVSSPG